MKITKPYATRASALPPPSALRTNLKDVLGCADTVHKSKPWQSIPKASSLIPLHRGHLGCKGGLSLVKPVLPRDITSHRSPPKKFWILQKIKAISVYDMMTVRKELKTLCGISYMCCAFRSPWVFHTEMFIIIIVLEHFYLPKRLPCTCSPAMEREQWERTEAAARKGRKIVTSLEKLHQFFFKQVLSWPQCEEKQARLLHCFLLMDISSLVKGISALQFFEELKWKDGSPEAGIFSLVEQAQVSQWQDRISFPPCDRNMFIGTAASAENWHDSRAVQSKVAAGFRGSQGRL